MKITFLVPISLSKMPIVIPNLGLGYLASALRARGHAVDIIDCNKEQLDFQGLAKRFRSNISDMIGIQVYSCDLAATRKTVSIIKEIEPGMRVVIGGPHPTALPEQSLRSLGADFAIAGEALYSLPRLVDLLENEGEDQLSSVGGLVWRDGSTTRRNEQEYIKNVDDLDVPAWDLMDPRTYPPAPHGVFARAFPTAPFIVSRGCAFNCTFCAGTLITGPGMRYRSIDKVMEEIEILRHRYGVRELHLIDDNFTSKRSYVKEFCMRISSLDPPLSWSCPNGIRLGTLDRPLVEIMKKSGCYSVLVGIESGTQRILDHMRKRTTPDKIREKVDLLVDAGIIVTGSFIIGYPEETLDDIKETVRFAKSLRIQQADFNCFVPIPGSSIYQTLKEKGELDEDSWDLFLPYSVPYSPPGISRLILKRIHKRAFLTFYARPRIALGILRSVRSTKHLMCVLKRVIDLFKRR